MTARPDIDGELLDQAIAWQRALERDDADWEGYAAWLEADLQHREIFNQLELVNRAVADRGGDLKRLLTPEPAAIARSSRRGWLVGSLAAAIAVAVVAPTVWFNAKDDVVYATRLGETRQVALQKGVTIELAPATTLVAKHGDAANLELASGEAFFTVAHDPSRTLRIAAADYTVSDIGTQFGMKVAPEQVTVGVADGHVAFGSQGGKATRVMAGQQIVAGRATHSIRLLPVAKQDVGSWRRGRLVYSNAPLSVVAADLSRFSGKVVSVDPSIRGRQFSGVLAIADGETVFDDLAGLTGTTYLEKGDRVRLSPRPSR